ncbi:MAG: hypothetical protein HRU75_01600 [Planctomycetia bacterium]|nr:MAG: hypothetical protein HRU75_01600 [Planctomycetia bacterium]
MRNAISRFGRQAAWVAAAAMLSLCSCTAGFLSYITEERQGNVFVIFVNNAPARAAFTFGSYDSLDRNPPGAVALQQLRIEANSSAAQVTLPCRRDIAVATAALIKRAIDTDADRNLTNFIADAFGETVHFSTAPANSDASSLPTAGEANGRNMRLGVDFTCGDTLIFTFEEDPDAPGGFRIDFEVIPDVEPDDDDRR